LITFAPSIGTPISGLITISSNRAATFTLENAPQGVSVQHGTNQITLGGSTSGIAAALTGLKLVSPYNSSEDHILTVTAQPVGDDASTSLATVAVDAVADGVTYTANHFMSPTYPWPQYGPASTGPWDVMNIDLSMIDRDQSELISFRIQSSRTGLSTYAETALPLDGNIGFTRHFLDENRNEHLILDIITREIENNSTRIQSLEFTLWP
jgi:hypothetical protein